MTQAPISRSSREPSDLEDSSDNITRPTVAALGIEARLIPSEPDLQHEFSRLIASCETLVEECERLFYCIRRIVEDGSQKRGSSPSSSSE